MALAGCGSSPSGVPAPAGASPFCPLFKATNDKLDTASAQLTRTASPQTVRSAPEEIITQMKAALDSSPPTAVKGDLQTVYDTMVATKGEFAAVDYEFIRLLRGPAAVKDPEFEQAARNIAHWGHLNCGTSSATPPATPTR